MLAVRLHECGDAAGASVDEVAVPAAVPGEVVVAIEACALNHLDLDLIDGTSRIPLALPHTLGLEGVGRIHAVGEGVTGWKRGGPGDGA